MITTEPLRSETTSQGDRDPTDRYPAGHPVHVVLRSYRRRPLFDIRGLAQPLFALVADHSQTLACCLMPDHLHWMIAEAASMQQLVESFKSYSTYAARSLGHRAQVWQPSHWDQVLWQDEDLSALARHIVQNPVRRGIVTDVREYPYQIVKI